MLNDLRSPDVYRHTEDCFRLVARLYVNIPVIKTVVLFNTLAYRVAWMHHIASWTPKPLMTTIVVLTRF